MNLDTLIQEAFQNKEDLRISSIAPPLMGERSLDSLVFSSHDLLSWLKAYHGEKISLLISEKTLVLRHLSFYVKVSLIESHLEIYFFSSLKKTLLAMVPPQKGWDEALKNLCNHRSWHLLPWSHEIKEIPDPIPPLLLLSEDRTIFSTFLAKLYLLPYEIRRQSFVIFVSKTLPTNRSTLAFQYSVDLILNIYHPHDLLWNFLKFYDTTF